MPLPYVRHVQVALNYFVEYDGASELQVVIGRGARILEPSHQFIGAVDVAQRNHVALALVARQRRLLVL
eukprot:3855225-Prymnesium_polylepis.1